MDLFKPEQKLSISFEKGGNLVEILCKISKVFDDRLEIELPPYFMRYIEFLETGKKLTAKVFSKLGTIDFNTVVITSPLEDNFSIEIDYNAMKLTPGEEIPVIEAVELVNATVGENLVKLSTFEISTEYIKFNSDKKFSEGQSFDCELILPKNHGIIKFRATVVEIDPVYDDEYKAVYSNMTEEDRQTLLYYMYLYSNNTD